MSGPHSKSTSLQRISLQQISIGLDGASFRIIILANGVCVTWCSYTVQFFYFLPPNVSARLHSYLNLRKLIKHFGCKGIIYKHNILI